ncbi:DUF2513 domain-containing protein [Blautia sp. OF03-15BH]|uniref:DUF2513 domain-containing protein n=1 Tax=Blautia sp. OF03-15BH TaxID=2292287 RepID=UPI000E4F79E5|nr:DUF2513 domain-containing protein [Blautia sp. OF03-15BH]RGX99816.1 DUF2513 domain-containing protein [Blautia sp. OF03-15BH]
MKLDLNCVRDSLLTLEKWLVLNDQLEFIFLDLNEIMESAEMQKYTKPDVAYTLVMLEEAGFIKAVIDYGCDEISELDVIRLTYQGHQFLETIRPKDTWDKIYAVAEKTGHKSLTSIMEIADIILPDVFKSALRS